MFNRWFGRERKANQALADALYAVIVAAARQAVLYADWKVPDTPLGRFEMIGMHMYLLQRRLRDESSMGEVTQILIDDFFTELDHSLRELGVGDLGVPKRMKKLARMYYGRSNAYDAALDAGDRPALAAALSRNIRPDSADWPQAQALADYVIAARDLLSDQTVDAIASGSLSFPDGRNLL